MNTIKEFDKDALKSFSDYASPGKIAGVYVVFNGTNATGVTNDFDATGTLVVRRKDETLMERKMGVFENYWNLRSGSALLNSTGGGSFLAAVPVPFWLEGSKNAYNVAANELEIEWQPDANAGSNFTSLSIEISRIKTNWKENYLLRMMGSDQNVTAGTSGQKFDINRRNVAEVLVRDKDTVLSKAGIFQEDRPIFDEQSKSYYEGLTIADSRIEANTFPMLRFKIYDESETQYRTRASMLNKSSQAVLTASGAGTVEITAVSVVPKKGVFLNV